MTNYISFCLFCHLNEQLVPCCLFTLYLNPFSTNAHGTGERETLSSLMSLSTGFSLTTALVLMRLARSA